MRTVCTLSVLALVVSASVPALSLADDAGRSAYYAPSPYAPLRKAIAAAQREYVKAMADAVKNDPNAEAVKDAQAAIVKARQDYRDALASVRQSLADDPHVGPLQTQARDLENRLREQGDSTVRLAIAGELMKVRNQLNTAEWEVIGVDPDVAVSKAAIDDAQRQYQTAVSQQQSALAGDPAVRAARQRVIDLRKQLRGH